MPIKISCPTCQARLKAPDNAVGRTFLCPGCKGQVTIPSSPPRPAPPSRREPTLAPSPALPARPLAPIRNEADEDGLLGDCENCPLVQENKEEVIDAFPVEEEEEISEADSREDGVEKLEEIEVPRGKPVDNRRQAKLAWSKLLRLRQIHVKVRDSRTWSCTLRDGERMLRVGWATEARDRVKRRTVYRVDIAEGRDDILVGSVAQLDPREDTLAIRGADDVEIGSYTPIPWGAQSHKPVWIFDDEGHKILKMVPERNKGRCSLQRANGQEVGELLTVAAHEGKARVGWFDRQGDFYLVFGSELDDQKQDKLLFLAAALGMDLLYAEDEPEEDD